MSSSSLIDKCRSICTDRPREVVSDLNGWIDREKGKRKLVQAVGRATDITTPESVIITESPDVQDAELSAPWLNQIWAEGGGTGMARSRVPWAKDAIGMLSLNPPMFWCGQSSWGDWAYVDLQRAYLSLWEPLTLDMRFRPWQTFPMLGWGRMPWFGLDEFEPVKNAYLAAGGLLRKTTMRLWDFGVFKTVDTTPWSKFLAPDLWGIMMYTLHAIAEQAVALGAICVVNDGYVIERDRADALVNVIERDWHMTARIKAEGEGTVFGCGSYSFGTLRSARVGHTAPERRDVIAVRPEVVRQLQRARGTIL